MAGIKKKMKSSSVHSLSGTLKKKAKGRPSANDGNVRERILKAAREIFTLYSFKAASTRMIAKQAGVEHPMIHYYFGSKEKLFYAMAEAIYNETIPVQESWYDGLEVINYREAFSIFIDRMLDHTMAFPEALQIAALNMVNIGNIEEIPAYRFILMSMASMRRIMEEKLVLRGSHREIEMFIYCFYSLMISLIGSRSCQAQILNMDPLEEKYRTWVKDASVTLFLPWFKRILFGQ
jgi:AcrR family transcriptional regulator